MLISMMKYMEVKYGEKFNRKQNLISIFKAHKITWKGVLISSRKCLPYREITQEGNTPA